MSPQPPSPSPSHPHEHQLACFTFTPEPRAQGLESGGSGQLLCAPGENTSGRVGSRVLGLRAAAAGVEEPPAGSRVTWGWRLPSPHPGSLPPPAPTRPGGLHSPSVLSHVLLSALMPLSAPLFRPGFLASRAVPGPGVEGQPRPAPCCEGASRLELLGPQSGC